MRKFFLFIVSSLFLFTATAQEQEKVDFSKWSISIDAGLNAFDGDIGAKSDKFFENVRGGLTLGGTIDYTFNPTISLGLMYNYLPLAANNHYAKARNSFTADFTSTYHLIAPVLSVNIINAISETVDTKWGLWFSVGAGLGFFSSELNKCEIDNSVETWTKSNVDGISVAIPLGANLEYNFTKNLALGLKIQYLTNSRDDIEGNPTKGRYTIDGVTNDFISSAAVNLRWKFNAKDNPHTRNSNWKAYKDAYPDGTLELAKRLEDDVEQLKKDHKDLKDEVLPRLDGLEARVGNIEMLLSNDGPDSDGDGVPDHRDKEPNTPRNTPVDFWGRSISKKDYATTPFIFFDHDKTALDNQAYETISMVTELLKANPMLLVEIRGFCDYTGTDAYNEKLSLRRAERVKKELVKQGIDAKRIGTNGKGRVLQPTEKYRPNRRVEFLFSE